jgi:outer membrane murein-binding lipoprotein Lpp
MQGPEPAGRPTTRLKAYNPPVHLDDEDIDRLGVLLEVRILARLTEMEQTIMAAIDDLNTAVQTLSADVDQLIALQQSGDQTPAIVAATDAVNAVDAKVTAITAPPAPAGN